MRFLKGTWRWASVLSLLWVASVSIAFAQETTFDPGSIQGAPSIITRADFGTAKNNEGYNLREAGKFEAAERSFKEALQYWDVHPPVDPLSRARCLNNLALLYQSERKYSEAISVYQQALIIEKNTLPAAGKLLAITLDNLAQSYRLQGNFKEAEPLYQQALLIEEKSCPDSQDNAITMFNLSLLYFQQEKYDQSKPLMEHSLGILKETLGATSPDYLNVYKYYTALLKKTN